ncbi:MAG TPA: efflux RND transporter periplasmic adaptor subunit [Bradyrhizobium sp.]|nr:efflux RND transporter periplasmic adaptor subunit [Bradyrhizobium sp.]
MLIICLGFALAACGRSAGPQSAGTTGKQENNASASGATTQPSQAQSPPPAVIVATVEVKDIAPRRSFIGHVVTIQAVQVVARVTAFIDEIAFKQGSTVQAGQVLFQLEKAQYQAAVDAAKAQLDSAQAALRVAQLAYQRASELVQKNAETQANLDQAVATRDQQQASVEAAQANLEQAQLNLSYCTISAPIKGRIGAVTLTKGNLVTPSTPALTSVNQLDPIRVQFAVSDQLIVTAQQKTNARSDQVGIGLPVQLDLPNGQAYAQTGKVAFLNNQVEAQTGTVSVFADFSNPAGVLLPGAYVTVHVGARQKQERPLVPVAAVQREQGGSSVLVVDQDNKVVQQPVQLGSQIDQNYVVDQGLKGGERVIVEGIQKVHPGQVVKAEPQPPQGSEAASGDADSHSTQGQSR